MMGEYFSRQEADQNFVLLIRELNNALNEYISEHLLYG